jgi:ribosomal protein S18 acetylase RimI-like enzyme
VADVTLRAAGAADAAEIAAVYLASRRAFLAYAPLAHGDDEVLRWLAEELIPGGGVTVATQDAGRPALVGMLAVSRGVDAGWIDQLYLLPATVGRGLGSRLLAHAQATLGAPIRLYTFQANTGARRFYERHGFHALAFGDGSGNEERCPDVLYEWKESRAQALR